MNEELGKRAVACKHWKWMLGMRLTGWDGNKYTISEQDEYNYPEQDEYNYLSYGMLDMCGRRWRPDEDCVPDFDDPATIGCLLHLVREAWGVVDILHEVGAGVWQIWCSDDLLITGDSEREVLVKALEAAE